MTAASAESYTLLASKDTVMVRLMRGGDHVIAEITSPRYGNYSHAIAKHFEEIHHLHPGVRTHRAIGILMDQAGVESTPTLRNFEIL